MKMILHNLKTLIKNFRRYFSMPKFILRYYFIRQAIKNAVVSTNQEERFRKLAESIPQQVWIANTDGSIEYVNQRSLNYFCCTQAELLGWQWLKMIHSEDVLNTLTAWNYALVTGTNYEIEFRLYDTASQTYRWHLGRAVPWNNQQGDIINWFGTNTDIHDRVLAEISLQNSERRYETIATISPVGIFHTDILGNCHYVNNRWCKITGINRETAVTMTWINTIHPEDRQRIEAEWYHALTQKLPFRSKYRFQRSHGEIVWVLGQTVPEIGAEGQVIAYVGTVTDISDHKQVEEALAERLRLANFQADIDAILIQAETLETMLRGCTDALVEHLDVAFARVWILNQEENVLELQVSSGMYTHIDGPHSRIPMGYLKIGLIAQEGHPYLINSIKNDPRISDQEWVKREGMVAFAGYPLIIEGKIIGVISMFCCHTISESTFNALAILADEIALGIQRKQTEIALRESEEYFRLLIEGVTDYAIYMLDPQGRVMSWNSGAEYITGYTSSEIIGEDFSCFFPAEDILNSLPIQQLNIAATQGRCECESIFLRKDNSRFWANCILTALYDDTGKVRGFSKVTRNITERKLAEKSLLRLEKAIESTSDAVSIADIYGQVIYVNPAFTKIFDYTFTQLNERGGLSANFQVKEVFERVFTTVQKGESWRGEVTMETANGNIVQVDLCTDAIKDSTDAIVYFVNIYTDITQRKIIEEDLRLSNRAIAANSNGIIIADVTTANKPIIYVNPAFEKMTGYLSADIIGQSFPLLANIQINQSELAQLTAAMTTGQDSTVILRNFHEDGSIYWHELNISPVYDYHGYITHYIGIQTDITKRKQAETALLISQQRLQYLLYSSPAVIYTGKADGDYGATFMSENVSSIMGYQAQDFLATSSFWYHHIHPEDAEYVITEVSKAIKSQGEYILEYRFLHQDGVYRWIYDQGKVVLDQAANPIEIVGYWADITNRKQLEQELIVALEKEKELNELKSRFISMTSHEFRTPLSTILSSSELLEHYRHRWSEEKQLTHLRRIQTAVGRMTEMLNDVLVIGKVEVGKLEYQPISMDLVAYCRQLLEDIKLNGNNQTFIDFDCEYESISCYMDDKLLSHILINLLSNAIKYSLDADLVKFTLICQNGKVIFEIEDQGIGIPEADIPRLFESFHRAGNVGTILGTGLGLAIVKKCVDIYQGEIFLTSQVDVGTKFTVTLPLS